MDSPLNIVTFCTVSLQGFPKAKKTASESYFAERFSVENAAGDDVGLTQPSVELSQVLKLLISH